MPRSSEYASWAGSLATVTIAAQGLPGTGKSQLTGPVVRDQAAGGWLLVGWVPARTRDCLLAGLAEMAGLVGVADPDGELRSAQRMRDHPQGRTEPGLLVLDNVTDPKEVLPLLPGTGPTRVMLLLLTSTEAGVSGLGVAVDVGGFPRPDSIAFLPGTGRDDPAGAYTLADELDDLPVALAQAAAILAGPPATGYRDLLEELAALPVEDTLQWQPGRDYPGPVGAALLLRVAAVLDPAGIAPDLVTGLAPDSLLPVRAPRVLRDAQARCLSRGLLTETDPGAGEPRWVMLRLRRQHRHRHRVHPARQRPGGEGARRPRWSRPPPGRDRRPPRRSRLRKLSRCRRL